MHNLALCIAFSSSLIIIFKLFQQYRVSASQAIFFNYVTCAVVGSVFLKGSFGQIASVGLTEPWVLLGMVAGCLFFVTFYLIAQSTKEAGIAATSVAQKVSLVLPVAASLLLWKTTDSLGLFTILGLVLAVVAVVLSSWRKSGANNQSEHKSDLLTRLLPALVFFNAGLADTLFNYVNFRYLTPELQSAFTMSVFSTAAVLGLLTQIVSVGFQGNKLELKSIPAGIILGIPNLLTLFFLLRSLSFFDNNGALVYPVNNIGVILVSTMFGIWFFGERLKPINWLGLGLAVLSLFLLLSSEL